MLRGIRKASANWLGRIVMGVVMSVLGRKFRGLGHQRHFPRLWPLDGRQDRRHRNPDRAVPADLYRRAADAQPAVRPCDHARRGDGARRAAAGLERDGRRGGLERARAADAAWRFRCRSLAAHRQQSGVPEPARPVRPRPLRGRHAQCRLQREALRRRAAQPDLAPADHRFGLRQYPAAECLARGAQSVSEPAAQHRLYRARSGASRRHSAADRGRAQQIFRYAQNHVPRAGIPQSRDRGGDAGGACQDRGSAGRGCQKDL